jgi:BirA family transcriptional regulator, biotin operon repressor / biotin---[acetyl-CoA-carboxylase] ligase
MIPLHTPSILQLLPPIPNLPALKIICLETVESTNAFLKTDQSEQVIVVCCAETQTAGRGRQGRQWISPPGENLYFSMRLMINQPITQLGSLSLVIGLACIAAIEKLIPTLDLQIKWPNDLMAIEKKLGGILIEILEATSYQTNLIIGIGINVNQTPLLDDNRPVTSLYDQTQCYQDRNPLIAALITSLLHHITLFEQQGWSVFQTQWEQVDYLEGRMLTFYQTGKILTGLACGINEKGQLLLKEPTGKTHTLSSGEVHISP